MLFVSSFLSLILLEMLLLSSRAVTPANHDSAIVCIPHNSVLFRLERVRHRNFQLPRTMEVTLLYHCSRHLPHFNGNYQALCRSFHSVDQALKKEGSLEAWTL